MEKRLPIKIDAVGSLRMYEKKGWFDVLHYFPIAIETKYEPKFSYKQVGKKYQRYQKVLSHREYRCPQWKNLWTDIKAFFQIPRLEWSLRYAIGMFALWLYAKKGVGLPLFMGAIAYDNSGQDAPDTNRTSASFSMTVAAAATVGVHSIVWTGASDPFVAANQTIGGTAVTADVSNAGNWFMHMGHLFNPSTGTVSWSSSWTGNRGACLAGITYTGTDTSGIGATANAYNGSATSQTVNITPLASNSMLVGMGGSNGATVYTGKTGETDRQQKSNSTNATSFVLSDAARSDTSLFAFGWDLNLSRDCTICVIELKAGVVTLTPSVNDSITVSESVVMQLKSFVNVSDSIVVSESVSMQIANLISVSESVLVSESVSMLEISNISISDSVVVSESVTVLIPVLVPNVNDSIVVSESVSVSVIYPPLLPNVYDSIVVSEWVCIHPNTPYPLQSRNSTSFSQQSRKSTSFSLPNRDSTIYDIC